MAQETAVDVKVGDRKYVTRVGSGILEQTDFTRFGSWKVAVITDNQVYTRHAEKVKKLLERQGMEPTVFSVLAGEKSKTPETATQLESKMASNGFDRDSLIVALGGGVVGDLAGYIASEYMRGIPYVQIPTSLLAMVDSSVGGKTAVNLPEGKNLVGRIYQPSEVIADTSFLKTLPPIQIGMGMSEVIKYGMALDPELLHYLSQNRPAIEEFVNETAPLPLDILAKIVERCVRLKAEVVAEDEFDTGYRSILNYGHTVGHAIETVFRQPHGIGVAIGMAFEGFMAARKGLLDGGMLEVQNGLLKSFGLPTAILREDSLSRDIEENMMIEAMRRDKKNQDGRTYVSIPLLGAAKVDEPVTFPVDEDLVRASFQYF